MCCASAVVGLTWMSATGRWNSVYVRFRRCAEQGVWDAVLATLVDLGLTDDWRHIIYSTIVRSHSQAAGAKGGPVKKALVEAAAALRTKSAPAVTVRETFLAWPNPTPCSPTKNMTMMPSAKTCYGAVSCRLFRP